MGELDLALITGVDIAIPSCQLIVHQPKIKEIALLGEKVFFSGVQCLNINKDLYKDESESFNFSNFQIFMRTMLDDRMKERKEHTIQVLSLICPNYQSIFTPNSLIFKKDEAIALIDDNNFDSFQQVLTQIFCTKAGQADSFNPTSEKGKEIAKKLMRARERVAQERSDEAGTLTAYVSSLAVAQHLSLLEVSNYTLFQLYDGLQRYQMQFAQDLEIRSRLAGGKSDDKIENWMRNIH